MDFSQLALLSDKAPAWTWLLSAHVRTYPTNFIPIAQCIYSGLDASHRLSLRFGSFLKMGGGMWCVPKLNGKDKVVSIYPNAVFPTPGGP